VRRAHRSPIRKRRHLGLLIKCFVLVAYIRLTLSFKSYAPILKRIKATQGDPKNHRQPLHFVWAVKKAARVVPKATCLTQALAVRWLMARSAQDCTIRIGVAPEAGGGIKAHAWVIYRDDIIIGGDDPDFESYTPITDL